jgi:hypothetical protein
MPPLNLIADEPVPDGECWYTVLTNSDFITSDGTLHTQALKGKRISQAIGKQWSHELSGRLVSLAGDVAAITADAEDRVANARQNFINKGAKVPSKIKFVGVACAKAVEVRTPVPNRPEMDVVFTPDYPYDPAHSDVVTYGTTTHEDVDPAREWLRRTLRIVRLQDLDNLIASCGPVLRPP